MKARKTNVVVIGSEAFTTAFRIIGIENTIEVKGIGKTEIQEVINTIRGLIEEGKASIFIVEEEYLSVVENIMEELKYSVFPIFISLPGPTRIRIHDPKSYYLNKIKGVLGISIEI